MHLATLNPMQHCTVKPCLEIAICRKGGGPGKRETEGMGQYKL